jgi:hypothetical protein
MTNELANAAEQFIAWHKDGAPKPAMLDYFAEIFGEALAKPQPVGGALTDAAILHRWDTHVGEPDAKRPLTDADKIDFARVIEREVLATLSAPVAQPGEAVERWRFSVDADGEGGLAWHPEGEWVKFEDLPKVASLEQASAEYFGKRPQIDTMDRRNVFKAGFESATPIAAQPAAADPAEDFAYLQRKLDRILSNVQIWEETGITKADVISEYVRDLQDEYAAPAQAAAVPERARSELLKLAEDYARHLVAVDFWSGKVIASAVLTPAYEARERLEAFAAALATPVSQTAAVPEAVERDAEPELLAMLKEATDALAGGLWDYGPGQDEHEKCNEVIERCRAVIDRLAAPEAGGQGDVSGEGEGS